MTNNIVTFPGRKIKASDFAAIDGCGEFNIPEAVVEAGYHYHRQARQMERNQPKATRRNLQSRINKAAKRHPGLIKPAQDTHYLTQNPIEGVAFIDGEMMALTDGKSRKRNAGRPVDQALREAVRSLARSWILGTGRTIVTTITEYEDSQGNDVVMVIDPFFSFAQKALSLLEISKTERQIQECYLRLRT